MINVSPTLNKIKFFKNNYVLKKCSLALVFIFLIGAGVFLNPKFVMAQTPASCIGGISISNPAGGDVWSGTQNIQWSTMLAPFCGAYLASDSVQVLYSRDNFTNTYPASPDIDYNASPFSWDTTPATGFIGDGTDYKVKIVDFRSPLVSSETLEFTLDNTDPTITNATSSQTAATTGSVLSITFDADDNLSGVATSSVTIDTSNNATWQSGSGTGSYSYQYTVTGTENGGADGNVDIVVTVDDEAGNQASTTLSLTLDFTPPTITATSATPVLASSTTMLDIQFNLDPADTDISTTSITINGSNNATFVSKVGDTYNFQYQVSNGDTSGTSTILITATDIAGNVATSTINTFFDFVGPIITNIAADSNIVATPLLASSTTEVTITFDSNDLGTDTESTEVTVNGNAATLVPPPSTGDGSYTYTYVGTTEVDGPATIVVTAYDDVGNAASSTLPSTDPSALVFDVTGPEVTLSYDPLAVQTGATTTITATFNEALNATTPTIAIDTSGTDLPATNMTWDGSNWTYVYTAPGGSTGASTVSIVSYDTLGNITSTTTNEIFQIDDTGPVVTNIVFNPEMNRDDSVVTMSFDATDDSGIATSAPSSPLTEVSIDGNTATYDREVSIGVNATRFFYTYDLGNPQAESEGSFTIDVNARDYAGNLTSESTTARIVFDFTVPAISAISTSKDPAMNADTININFSASDVNGSLTVSEIDTTAVTVGGRNANFVSSTTSATPGLIDYVYSYTIDDTVDTEGDNTVEITVTDGAGNSSVNNTITDQTFDFTSVESTLSYSDTDEIVREADVITITATTSEALSAPPTINIDTTGTDDSGTMTQDPSDPLLFTYSYTVPAGSDGAVTVTLTGTDDAGNSITTINNQDFTIDNTGPTITNTNFTPSVASSTSDLTIIFDSTDTNGINSTSVTVDGNDAFFVSESGGTYTYTYDLAVYSASDRDVITPTIIINADDIAGNTSTDSSTTTITFDFSVPVITNLVSAPDPTSEANDLVITFTVNEVLSTSTVTVDGNAANFSSSSTNATPGLFDYEFVYDVTGAENGGVSGDITVNVSVFDLALTEGTAATTTQTFDFVGPVVSLSYNPTGSYQTGATTTITATFNETASGTPQISIDTANTDLANTPMISTADPLVWEYLYTVPASSDGIATVTIEAIDLLENSVSSTTNQTFIIDNNAPVISNNPTAILASSSVIIITFDATDLSGIDSTSVLVGSAAATFVSQVGDTYTYSFDTGRTSSGSDNFNITINATDTTGSTASSAASVSVTFDFIDPVITLTSAIPDYPNSGDTVVITFSSNEDLSTSTVTIDGVDAIWSSGSGSGPYTFDYSVTGSETPGARPIVITGIDLAGNEGATSSVLNIDFTGLTATFSYSPSSSSRSGETLAITVLFSKAINFTGGATVPAIDIETSAGTVSNAMTASTTALTYTFDYTVPTGDGNATTSISDVTDASLGGGVVTYVNRNFTIDNSAPTAVLSGLPAGSTNDTAIIVTVLGDDDVVDYKYSLDGAAYSANWISIATSISESGLSTTTAPHTLNVIGRDSAGNEQTTALSTSYSWTVVDLPASTSGTTGGTTIVNTTSSGGSVSVFRVYPEDTVLVEETPVDTTPIVTTPKTERDLQLEQIIDEAIIVFESSANFNRLLIHNSAERSILEEGRHLNEYTTALIDGYPALNDNVVNAINNFIYYGTQSTKILGAGERAGVVDSYKKAFNKLPQSIIEWRDVIAIGNGRWPKENSQAAINNAKKEFVNVYKREARMEDQNDNAAVTIIAYGLRSKNRNLDSEKAAILSFEDIYKYHPINALDWDIVRSIAYSGSARSAGEVNEAVQSQTCKIDIDLNEYLIAGGSSDEIEKLQVLLQCLGYFPSYLNASGYFGPVTENSLKLFQTASNMQPSGLLNKETIKLLNNYNDKIKETASIVTQEATESDQIQECSSNIDFTQNIEFQYRNDEIAKLQTLLKCLGYFPEYIDATGYFGSNTIDSIINFQNAKNIEATGSINQETINAINEYSTTIKAASNLKKEKSSAIISTEKTSQCTTNTNFELGDNSGKIKDLQELLKCLGYFPQEIDISEFFGSITREGIKEFQINNNFFPSGELNQKTIDLLNSYSIEREVIVVDRLNIAEEVQVCSSVNIDFNKNIEPDYRNEEIKKLQSLLKCLGHYPGYLNATGYFGTTTVESISNFQTDNNIEPTGDLDQVTIEFLNSY